MSRVIIDGYNLIRQVRELTAKEQVSLQDGRDALVAKLKIYRKYKPHSILVVFDGKSEMSERSEAYKEGGISICYSTSSQTADEAIQDFLKGDLQDVVLVTSDRALQQYAETRGCAVMESPAFYRKLELALAMAGQGGKIEDDEPQGPQHKRWATFKKGPRKRLPKKARRNKNRLKDL